MHKPYSWQQTQWREINKRAEQMPHALLLTGVKGMGKLNFAYTLAEKLLCESSQEFACGECRSCQLLLAQTHPDLLILQPEAEGKLIKVDQVRQLVADLAQTPQLASRQVAILEPAEAMNKASANALLKTLEEPPGQVVIILVSHGAARLMPTIRSRCQRLQFSPPSAQHTQTWLQQQQVDHAEVLTALAEGVPLQAMQFSQPDVWQQRQQLLQDLTQFCQQQLDPVQMAAKCLKWQLAQLLQCLATICMDVVRLQSGVGEQYLVNQDQQPLLEILSKNMQLQAVFKLLDQLMESLKLAHSQVNLNMQLLLETLFVSMRRQ